MRCSVFLGQNMFTHTQCSHYSYFYLVESLFYRKRALENEMVSIIQFGNALVKDAKESQSQQDQLVRNTYENPIYHDKDASEQFC